MHRWFLGGMLLVGCHPSAPATPVPEDCAPKAPAAARAIELEAVPQLAGRWVLEVMTQVPEPARGSERVALLLRKPAVPGEPGQVGPALMLEGELGYGRAVEVRGTTLRVGTCRSSCVDGSVTVYWLLAQQGDRIWGTREAFDGIAMTTDAQGGVAPNPGGYFCAKRAA